MTVTWTDLFAGAGGSTSGAVQVAGVEVVMAANHWKLAIAVHNQNHPTTDHAAADLHEEDPRFFPRTDCLWASPECTKWSGANAQPKPAIEAGLFEDPHADDAAQRSRLLMFDVLRFAAHHRYRLMMIENVVNIATEAKYRLAWHEWRRQLTNLGYRFRVVSLNSMHAQAFGPPAPQSRDRIYIVCWRAGDRAPDFERILRPRAYCARCDEMVESQQAWKPGKSVGRYRQSYVYVHAGCGTTVEPGYLPAASIIDWSKPGERIGDRPVKDFYDKKGNYLGRGHLSPKTEARIAVGIARYWALDDCPGVVEQDPFGVPVEGRDGKHAMRLDLPLRTQTTRLETALVAGGIRTAGGVPFVAELRGGSSDARSLTDPVATFCASGNHHGLVTPAGGTWSDDAMPTSEALRTLQTREAYALVSPYYGSAEYAKPADQPIGTLTTVDRYALVHRNNSGGPEMTTPVTEYLRTLTTAGHQSLIQAGDRRGAWRLGRPKVSPADLKAAQKLLADCLFRMFTHLECAAGQAFSPTYDWDVRDDRGRKPSNRALVKMIGNAVTPPSARDLVACGTEALTGEMVEVAA